MNKLISISCSKNSLFDDINTMNYGILSNQQNDTMFRGIRSIPTPLSITSKLRNDY